MLMLCALCLAVRDKKTRISLRAGASRKSYHAHASCFVLSAWRAVTKKPDKHEAESTKHGAQSMSIKHKARSMSTKQRQKNWAQAIFSGRMDYWKKLCNILRVVFLFVFINNYLFDKKKVKLFFTVLFSSAKKSFFITSAPRGRGWGCTSFYTKKQ
jgi:hypothetical protein